ncbi:MAG TPA: heat-inducible transcriptional repressor HrcA [Vicinamibacterales bacterium]|nr:heat-inducible transcriptional repressor HrcA [Vicinamibacterales bacterium]
MTRHPELPERDRRILGAVVQAYIDHGEPISSLWLASRGFGVSSATLRNVMARLEELGYVRQPHTSAGRVPTDMGYRSYVDQLLSERRTARLAPDVEERLRRAGTVEDVLSHASQEISRASHQVGFAMVPATEATFEHLDFVPLDLGRILVVLVSTGGHISHRVIEPQEAFSRTDLQQAANFLNSEFKGHSLTEIRQAIVDRLGEDRTLYDQLSALALRLASSTFEGLERQPSVYIQGTALLLEMAVGHDPETTLATMRALVRIIEEKSRLVKLIDACMDGNGLTVYIGSEHQDPGLQNFSVVTSTYTDGRRTGAVGIIGPTRMRYSRAINVVDSLSRTINRVFDNS